MQVGLVRLTAMYNLLRQYDTNLLYKKEQKFITNVSVFTTYRRNECPEQRNSCKNLTITVPTKSPANNIRSLMDLEKIQSVLLLVI